MGFWFERVAAAAACEQDTNPIVGDPAQVGTLAKKLTGTAESLKTQADRLRSVNSEQFWKGEAAAEFAHLKEKLPPLLDKVVKRYSAVGDALAKYSPDLQHAQEGGQRALQAYRDAKAQQQSAQANATQYGQLEQQARQQNRPLVWNGQHPSSQVEGANSAVANAIRMMTDSIDSRNAAASTCSGRISDAIDDDLKNDDSLWGKAKKIGKGIVDALEKIAPILRKVAAVLGIAAALLCWVPVLGQVLAGAALVVSAVTLAVDLTLKASGKDVSWGDIALDAIGVIPFGRAARLAKFAKPAKGLGLAAKAKGYVAYGKEIVRQIGPGYREIATAGRAVATGSATVRSIGQGAVSRFDALGGIKGVAGDIGPLSFALTANKIRGFFGDDGGGASAAAIAPTNPAAVASGLPVRSPGTATTGVTSQPVTLPIAA